MPHLAQSGTRAKSCSSQCAGTVAAEGNFTTASATCQIRLSMLVLIGSGGQGMSQGRGRGTAWYLGFRRCDSRQRTNVAWMSSDRQLSPMRMLLGRSTKAMFVDCESVRNVVTPSAAGRAIRASSGDGCGQEHQLAASMVNICTTATLRDAEVVATKDTARAAQSGYYTAYRKRLCTSSPVAQLASA